MSSLKNVHVMNSNMKIYSVISKSRLKLFAKTPDLQQRLPTLSYTKKYLVDF
jgi:hypothetical protein